MKRFVFIVVLSLLLFSSTREAFPQTFKKYFVDSTDQAFDMSKFLATRIGLMPVPFIITEPAVGYGAGLGLVFFHRTKEEKETGVFSKLPPSLTMVAGLYTENGTWMGMLGHQGSYLKDHLRYFGAIGYTNLNTTFYGTGRIFQDLAVEFNLNGFILFQELLVRIKKTNLFLGANYSFFGSTAKFYTGLNIPGLEELKTDIYNAGINAVVQYDSRDNIFTPSKGYFTALQIGYFGPELGGDRSYQNLDWRNYYWVPAVKDKLIAGFRAKGTYRWGDVPFYNLPFIQLRGIPALRYQGNVALVGETEWRWNVWRRWSLIGFAGSGWVANEWVDLHLDEAKISYGTGFRYFIAREYGMHVGLDFAWGPEDFIWYVTMGTAWFR